MSGGYVISMTYGALHSCFQGLTDMSMRVANTLRSVLATMLAILAVVYGGDVMAQGAATSGTNVQKTLRLVVLGDSLSAGYGLPAEAAFPAVLERALKAKGHAVTLVNGGVSGDTMSGGLARLDWTVGEGTDGVIVELGANDSLRGLDPEATRTALNEIVTRLKARHIPVMLAGMYAPPNMGPEYVARFNTIYPDIAKTHELVLYPFFLEGVAGQRDLNLPDGIHPTTAGVNEIVIRIVPTVEQFIARINLPR
jgi:acyl-CoA thioesterase I